MATWTHEVSFLRPYPTQKRLEDILGENGFSVMTKEMHSQTIESIKTDESGIKKLRQAGLHINVVQL